MAEVFIYSILSVIGVSLISLIGLFTLSMDLNKLKNYIHILVSFSAGGLFGGAFLHLLPEVVETYGFTLEISLSILAAIVFSFITEKFIRWRHCHEPTCDDHPHPLASMNLIGDSVHNFMDGMIIGASYMVNIQVGIATTIAVILHEIPQEIGDFGVLIHAGLSRKKALLFNFGVALTAVLGVFVAIYLGSFIEHIEYFIAPFAAGMFIYIAGSDIIPELHKEEKSVAKSFAELIAFCTGVLIMLSLLFL